MNYVRVCVYLCHSTTDTREVAGERAAVWEMGVVMGANVMGVIQTGPCGPIRMPDAGWVQASGSSNTS